MEKEKLYFYNYLLKISSIAKIGLKYSKDPYAIENYKEINDLTLKYLEDFENVNFNRNNFFEKDIYPTPNISVRTVILNKDKEVLLVKEVDSQTYSLPGGWCDLFFSPSKAAQKECLEEAGVDIDIVKLVAVLDRTPFKSDVSVPEFLIVFLGEIIADTHVTCHETDDVRFFKINDLPKMSRKTSLKELERIFLAINENTTIYD